jgi:hypothetical protein
MNNEIKETILEKAKEQLPSLEKALADILGIKLKLEIVKEGEWFKVRSQDLTNKVPQFLSHLFKRISIEGFITEEWYGLNVWLNYQYDHPCGSNGYKLGRAIFHSKEKKQSYDEWSFHLENI